MTLLLVALLSFVVGGLVSAVIMSCLCMASDADERMEVNRD